jgi:hypothetical protein
MLTARRKEVDRVRGLELGADDYVGEVITRERPLDEAWGYERCPTAWILTLHGHGYKFAAV